MLVHGAARGSRSWGRVLPLLEKQVYSVTAIDLPGRAGYGKPGWRMKLDDYAAAVVHEVRKIAAPTILVGHSTGGQLQLNNIVTLGSVRSLKRALRWPEALALVLLIPHKLSCQKPKTENRKPKTEPGPS